MAHYTLLLDDQRFGPAGTAVDLAEDYAAWLNRDRPGLLAPAEAERAVGAPPHDRQTKKAPHKRGGGKTQ